MGVLKYNVAQTKAAYSLFLTDFEAISKLEKNLLLTYTIALGEQKIPPILKGKY
jgi:hypothetical protein